MSLRLHEIAEDNHRILNPFTDAHLLEVGAVTRVEPGTRVLDLACGKGELLSRWAQELGSSGVGVDLSEVFVAAARVRADELGVADRVVIEHGDAQAYEPEPGAFDMACCIGATWIGNGVAGTIDLLRPAVTSDGLLLIGEPYWRESPTSAAERALGEDMFTDLPGLHDRFEAAGTELVEMVLADEHSWDRYVAAHWWTLRQWLDTHPADPLTPDVQKFLDDSRHEYLTYQRRYMGWGVFVLRPSR
jgi:cyclopropane fatty-acyl-phospholipid synthase-like methyltransferase